MKIHGNKFYHIIVGKYFNRFLARSHLFGHCLKIAVQQRITI